MRGHCIGLRDDELTVEVVLPAFASCWSRNLSTSNGLASASRPPCILGLSSHRLAGGLHPCSPSPSAKLRAGACRLTSHRSSRVFPWAGRLHELPPHSMRQPRVFAVRHPPDEHGAAYCTRWKLVHLAEAMEMA